VQWQNMAVGKYKKVKIANCQDPQKFYPAKVKAYMVYIG
jgi:hypothetical protein